MTVDLVRQFPSVSVFDIGAVLEQVRRSMDRAALAVQYVFLFTLAAGVMVLLAAIQATRDERMFESAVLRTLGARRSVVLQGVAAEFTALGLLAGTLAAVGAAIIGYLIATQLFQLDFVPGVALVARRARRRSARRRRQRHARRALRHQSLAGRYVARRLSVPRYHSRADGKD